MNDLLPGRRVRIRSHRCHGTGRWAGHVGTVIYADSGHGPDRTYDVAFIGLATATFCATEVDELPDTERGEREVDLVPSCPAGLPEASQAVHPCHEASHRLSDAAGS